jgi:hypothetical protein
MIETLTVEFDGGMLSSGAGLGVARYDEDAIRLV